MPPAIASTKKPATSASETRFEMVIVKRSLAAANAIRAGKSRRRARSRIMGCVLRPGSVAGSGRRRMLAGSAKQTDNGGSVLGAGDPVPAASPDAGDARRERDHREQQRKADPIDRRVGSRRFRLARRNRGIGSVPAQRHWNSPGPKKQ